MTQRTSPAIRDHPCALCGAPHASFGFGPPVRWVAGRDGAREVRRPVRDVEAVWACGAHREAVAAVDRARRGLLETRRDVSQPLISGSEVKRPADAMPISSPSPAVEKVDTPPQARAAVAPAQGVLL